ncbi:MAG: DUF1570 domain-containing protein [Myxococcaceae bacterium]
MWFSRRTWVGAALGVAVFACGGRPQRSSVALSGRMLSAQWWTVQTEHFTLRTNLDASAAEGAARELELLRSALLGALFSENLSPAGKLSAVIFRDPEELTEFVQREVDGFVTSTPAGPLLVAASQGGLLRDSKLRRAALVHELAHYLSAFVLLRQPRWFSEGLAEYLESAEIEAGGRGVVLGRVNEDNLKLLRRVGPLGIDMLWAWDVDGSQPVDSAQHYASAWLWIHFLRHAEPVRYEAFERRLRKADDPLDAFESAFSGVSAGALTDRAYDYLRRGEFRVTRRATEVPQTTAKREALSKAEVHALRATLFLEAPGGLSEATQRLRAEAEAAQALELDATNVTAALVVAPFRSREARLALARSLVRTHSTDGRAWSFFAGELINDASLRAERKLALERALKYSPDDPVALNNLAYELVETGRAAEGLALSERAVRQAPWSPAFLDTYAAALHDVGRCPEALTTQQRALELMHEGVSAAERQTFRAALVKYRASCGSP